MTMLPRRATKRVLVPDSFFSRLSIHFRTLSILFFSKSEFFTCSNPWEHFISGKKQMLISIITQDSDLIIKQCMSHQNSWHFTASVAGKRWQIQRALIIWAVSIK